MSLEMGEKRDTYHQLDELTRKVYTLTATEDLVDAADRLIAKSGDMVFTELVGGVREVVRLWLQEKQSVFSKYSDDPEVLTALAFNAIAVHGKKRKSGQTYASHPIKVAEISLLTLEAATAEQQKEALLLALLHDVLEEDTVPFLQGKKQKQQLGLVPTDQNAVFSTLEAVTLALDTFGHTFGDAMNAEDLIYLMEPVLEKDTFLLDGHDPYFVELLFFITLLKMTRNKVVVTTEIADRIAELHDLTYITEGTIPFDAKKQKLLLTFAKCFYFVEELMSIHGADGNLLNDIYAFFRFSLYSIIEKHRDYVTLSEVMNTVQFFDNFNKSHEKMMQDTITTYLADLGIAKEGLETL